MEAINSMASAAAKAVWGENKTEEPVSGKTGDTTKGEPFDAGNLDESSSTKTPKLGDAEHAKTTGTAKEPESAPNNPSANLKNTSTPADTTKGQNDVRDPENTQTHPKGEPTDVDDSGDGPNKAQKLDGPGPRPLDEVAKEHGGDAGSTEKVDTKGDSGPDAPADGNDEVNKKSTGEGTGEQYVKSSGLKADGGDFDATKPGAGREADRLLEEKGIHNPTDTSKKDSTPSAAEASDEKEKVSLKDKIKAKLHKH